MTAGQWATTTVDVPNTVDGAVSANVELAGRRYRLCYESDGILASGGDPFLAAAVVAAMRIGGRLRLHAPVSPRLLTGVETLQDILLTWDRYEWESGLCPVVVESDTERPEAPSGRGVGAFFSGGIDSFYSVVKHRSEITHLIFVRGFETWPPQPEVEASISEIVRQAAAELGKELIEVRTNVRSFSEPLVGWLLYHGAALASVALLLSARLVKVYIPATLTYLSPSPLGSHPLLDPLWSTEGLEIVHDGAEASRADKVLALAEEPAAWHWLRVCWDSRRPGYNCGECHKCLLTMVCLRAAGLLDSFRTFGPLDLEAVAGTRPTSRRPFTWEQVLRRLDETGSDPALADAVRRCLAGHHGRETNPS